MKELQNKTEKHDHENSLKLLKIDIESYKNKYISLKEKKILIIISEILIGSASTISSSTMVLINHGAGITISSSAALLTSIALLITNEYISKKNTVYKATRLD